MNEGARHAPAVLDKSLHRLESLVAALDQLADPRARETARELMELLLDLHGLALARLNAIMAAAENGPALIDRAVADPHVRAMLLLHGLHPHDARRRIGDAIGARQAEWAARGVAVEIVPIGASAVRILIRHDGGEAPEALRREVEQIAIDAAPDLDEIAVEVEAPRAAGRAAAGTLAMLVP